MSYETISYDISAIEAKDHFCQHKLLFKSEQWDTLNGCVAILKKCSEWRELRSRWIAFERNPLRC